MQPSDTDSSEIGLEAVEVVPVAQHRRRPKAALGDQVLEEPWDRISERDSKMRAAGALEACYNEFEQLLDRAADGPDEALSHPAASVTGRADTPVHERLDVAGQVRQRPGALLAGELPEGDE